MSLPTVSVILPNYNHAQYLPQGLNSMLDQSVKPTEIIVIDDCSTDNSIEVISDFVRRDSVVKLIQNERNIGTMPSNIKGLEQATCDYILLAAADDYLLPGFFEKSLKLLAKYPAAGLCSALSRRINEKGEYLDTVPKPPYLSTSPSYIPAQKMRDIMINRDNWAIMPTTALFNRKLANEARAFSPESGRYLDGFAAVLMILNYGACFIPEELAVFRILPKSVSAIARKDPKVHLQEVSPMWELMETTYADKFPPEFRRSLKRRHLYQYGAMATKQLDDFLVGFVEDLKVALKNPSLMDRLLFGGIWILSKVQFCMVRTYLFFRLRKINTDIIWRIIHRIKNPPKK